MMNPRVLKPHQWRRTPNGEIDNSTGADNHNGPVCERCGEGFCMFCEADRWHALLANPDAPERAGTAAYSRR